MTCFLLLGELATLTYEAIRYNIISPHPGTLGVPHFESPPEPILYDRQSPLGV